MHPSFISWVFIAADGVGLALTAYFLWIGDTSRRGRNIGLVSCAVLIFNFSLLWLSNGALGSVNYKIDKPQRSGGGTSSETLNEQLKELVGGSLVFDVAERMRVGDTKQVRIRIADNPNIDMSVDLKGPHHTVIPIKVGRYMTVKLEGGDAFTIKPLTAEDQFIGHDTFTEWSYDVTGLKSGDQKLLLTVGVRVKMDRGTDERRFYPVFERTIHVDVSVRHTTETFIENNWQWLASSIVLPVLAFFLGLWW